MVRQPEEIGVAPGGGIEVDTVQSKASEEECGVCSVHRVFQP